MTPHTDTAKTAALVLFALAVLPFVLYAVPQLAGASHSYVVLSDSMSPAIDAGDVVFVADRPVAEIGEGDVITFESVDLAAGSGSSLVTHRVAAVVEDGGERAFRTKGDANEEADPELVPADDVVGAVSFHLPYVGYVVAFAGTRLGSLLFLVVPAVLLGGSELYDLYRAAETEESA
ncbi:signal peptidase I [Halogeometricum luteum]|uniref:Signal peptidase I n=1 Tax=Halogeometricum luteum TaxID=2950537 RepID=A0ABU2FXS6_9EURY|nr:signal peptidase I [Halogeometricum sp. S3BR5-2]MDS0292809.1 signal peptidase I [Halogeometricum sp. S3BR5-2]